jgi:hypothetical protein
VLGKVPQLPVVLLRGGLLFYSWSVLGFPAGTRSITSAEWAGRLEYLGTLFLMAVLHHAGPIRVDLGIAPRILPVALRLDIALVNGVLPRRVHRRRGAG